jgi:hypothetical protein
MEEPFLVLLLTISKLKGILMAWDVNAASTLFSAGFSTLIASVISIIVTKRTILSQNECKLHDEILQLNLLAIEYPYFEDDDFCYAYSPSLNSPECLRYDSYCCIVYNLLQKIWEHFNKDTTKIERFFGSKEMFVRHKKWWLSQKNRTPNIDGYPIEFVNYVDSQSN